jgi:hypothetical protein
LIEFISYEGTVFGRDNVASNIISKDVVVSENGNGLTTGSIQRRIDDSNRWIVNDDRNTRGASNDCCPVNPVFGPLRYDKQYNCLVCYFVFGLLFQSSIQVFVSFFLILFSSLM